MNSVKQTVGEWEFGLGQQVRAIRLRLNLDQLTLADSAGISLTALKNLETGKGAAVKTLIRVLRALNRVEWLDTLAPPVSISPLQMLKSKKVKQRASSPRKARNVQAG
jgi:transcriptional regulator with XRE-family HTH domain